MILIPFHNVISKVSFSNFKVHDGKPNGKIKCVLFAVAQSLATKNIHVTFGKSQIKDL